MFYLFDTITNEPLTIANTVDGIHILKNHHRKYHYHWIFVKCTVNPKYCVPYKEWSKKHPPSADYCNTYSQTYINRTIGISEVTAANGQIIRVSARSQAEIPGHMTGSKLLPI